MVLKIDEFMEVDKLTQETKKTLKDYNKRISKNERTNDVLLERTKGLPDMYVQVKEVSDKLLGDKYNKKGLVDEHDEMYEYYKTVKNTLNTLRTVAIFFGLGSLPGFFAGIIQIIQVIKLFTGN